METMSIDDIAQVNGSLSMGEGALALIGLTFAAPATLAGAAAFGIGMGLLFAHTYYTSM